MKLLALVTSLVGPLAAVHATDEVVRKSLAAVFARAAKSSKSGSGTTRETGYSYCTWSPNTSCYASSWPRCCAEDGGVNCPRERPGCDEAGASYCAWAPDYSCYASGWPRCCTENGGRGCPTEQPGCDKAGASYCVWGPDYSCYSSGWPRCCAGNGGLDCPPGQPVCDKAGASYCVWSPDNSCYASGWPECCAENGGRDCPDEQPGCDMSVDDCVELGNTAAELIVMHSWCRPGNGGTPPFRTPDYVSQCKEVASSVCEGHVPDVAKRWCPDKTMTTTTMLQLQGECEEQVDSMVPGLKLAFKG